MQTMATGGSRHPRGEAVDIVGIRSNTNGRSCTEHAICGEILDRDMVVRFRKVQVMKGGSSVDAIAVYHVTDGIDACRVGFLKEHLVPRWSHYEMKLAQIVELYGCSLNSYKRSRHYRNLGCCRAIIISQDDEDDEAAENKGDDGNETTDGKEDGKEGGDDNEDTDADE